MTVDEILNVGESLTVNDDDTDKDNVRDGPERLLVSVCSFEGLKDVVRPADDDSLPFVDVGVAVIDMRGDGPDGLFVSVRSLEGLKDAVLPGVKVSLSVNVEVGDNETLRETEVLRVSECSFDGLKDVLCKPVLDQLKESVKVGVGDSDWECSAEAVRDVVLECRKRPLGRLASTPVTLSSIATTNAANITEQLLTAAGARHNRSSFRGLLPAMRGGRERDFSKRGSTRGTTR